MLGNLVSILHEDLKTEFLLNFAGIFFRMGQLKNYINELVKIKSKYKAFSNSVIAMYPQKHNKNLQLHKGFKD